MMNLRRRLLGWTRPVSDGSWNLMSPKDLVARLEKDIARLDPPMVAAVLVISLSRSDRIEAIIDRPGCSEALEEWLGRIAQILQKSDYVALPSENEIWVVLPRLSSTAVAQIAASSLVQALEAPTGSRRRVVTMRPVIGIAVGLHRNEKAMEMLSAATDASFRARAFSQRYCMAAAGDRNTVSGKDLLQSVQKALMQNQLSVHYQPKVRLDSGKVESAEALVRWAGAPDQAIQPSMIASIAEQHGMMQELTRFVLNTSLREFATSLGDSGIRKLWINLSASMLHDLQLPQILKQTIATWDVKPRNIGLEITESTLLADVDHTQSTLRALVQMGFDLAIDDFGTGYSSLAYLRRFPVRELKIDKLFIENMATSEPDRQIVQAIVDLAHICRIEVVAEGVEDQQTLALLKEMRCDVVQGYVYAKAMPATELVKWMQQANASTSRETN